MRPPKKKTIVGQINGRWERAFRQACIDNDLQEFELLGQLGMHASFVSQLRSSDVNRNVQLHHVFIMCSRFGFSPRWLLLGEGAMRAERRLSIDERFDALDAKLDRVIRAEGVV